MQIVGLMVAQNEEVCVGMTVDTVKDIVDSIVFVDHSSKDKTRKIVRERCEKYKIQLYEYTAGLELRLKDVRKIALERGKKLNPEWFYSIDADMVFTNQKTIRGLAEEGSYDQYWFRTLNLYGDIKHRRTPGLNIPHPYLFRNKDAPIQTEGVYCGSTNHYPKDPNGDRFIGWNLDGLKYYDHIFERFQLWYTRMWNARHKTRYSVQQYIEHFFNGKPTVYYMKCFALNRLRALSRKSEWIASIKGIDNFEGMYMNYPPIIKDWDCPFNLIIGPEDTHGLDVVGREPDLINVPVLQDSEIYQLKHHQEYK